MPRANRYFLPGCVWHITHRCYMVQLGIRVRDIYSNNEGCTLRESAATYQIGHNKEYSKVGKQAFLE